MKTRIIHVTEALGGGITSAINTYVDNSSQYQHYLFASVRANDVTGEENNGRFEDVRLVPRKLSSLAFLKEYIDQIQPDVIHVHSTYAGVLVRLMPFVDTRKIVYTPHAYAFLRNDHPLKLKAYYAIEWLLARRTAVTAGCGRDEMNIAMQLHPSGRAAELINICGALPAIHRQPVTTPPVVVMIGRVCEQKGFAFFADAAERVGNAARFVWIGGGDEDGVARLKAAGVEVTGWVTRAQVLQHLEQAALYFHSAAWDGFPISVLEAANYDIPMVLRGIGPFTAEGLHTVDNPSEAADMICRFAEQNQSVLASTAENATMVREYHSAANLQQSLMRLYNSFGEQK